jgi:hypothetical protein
MSMQEKIQSRLQKSDAPTNWFEGQKSYCVVLDSVRSDMETVESFTIKFSLLTKVPVTKTKHMIAKFPATVWTGYGHAKAENILSLIEEAGGVGRIIEGATEALVRDSSKSGKAHLTCRWCGFPLKETDIFCGFCMMPTQESENPGRHWSGHSKLAGMPPRRLFLYIAILVLGAIVISLLSK